jgi:hypothetical protein
LAIPVYVRAAIAVFRIVFSTQPMKYLAFAVAILPVWLPSSPLQSQGCTPTWPDAEFDVEIYATPFTDSAYAAQRGSEIELVSSTDSIYLVQTPSVCEAVLREAVAYLRVNNPIWREHREGQYEFAVFRFGPYYAITITSWEHGKPTLEAGPLPDRGYTPRTMVFRVPDLQFLKIMP